MRNSILALALSAVLAGCSAAPAPEEPPKPPPMQGASHRGVGNSACNASAVQSYVGRRYSDALKSNLISQSHAEQARVLMPDSAATLDYRRERLNIHLDEEERISELRCG